MEVSVPGSEFVFDVDLLTSAANDVVKPARNFLSGVIFEVAISPGLLAAIAANNDGIVGARVIPRQ